jgi:SAM-dependent methyltransferase
MLETLKNFLKNKYKEMKISYLGDKAFKIPLKYHSQFVCLGGASEIQFTLAKVIEKYFKTKEIKILIIGVFNGRDFYFLKEIMGYKVYALDLDLEPNIKNDIGDVQKPLPYPENFFDMVILSHVLEHLIRDHDALLNIRKVLKDEGIFWLAVPFFSDRQNDHIRIYSKLTTERLLQACGFEVVDYFEKPSLFFFPKINNYFIHAINFLFFILFHKTLYKFILPVLWRLDFFLSKRNLFFRKFSKLRQGIFICKKGDFFDFIKLNIDNYFKNF